MKSQKGQGILEFAIILPLFLLLSIGAIFFGMMFADYVAINSIASRSAREASLITASEYTNSGYNYEAIRQKFSTQTMPAGIYTWDYSKDSDFHIEYDIQNQAVLVEVTATIDKTSGFYPAVGNLLEGSALEKLTVTYRMFSEEKLPDKPTE